jgi:Na+-transporting methylmalonyl-CoA/oxaloacetate decarboxylase beta subunit
METVIDKARELFTYIVDITAKATGVYIMLANRMQNYCLDIIECIINAQYSKDIKKQKELQNKTIVQIKVLTDLADIAQSAGVITTKQYDKLAVMTADVNGLLIRCGGAITQELTTGDS